MLRRIIEFHLEHRLFVLVGLLGIIAVGLYTMYQIPVDAFPDLTNNQVVIILMAEFGIKITPAVFVGYKYRKTQLIRDPFFHGFNIPADSKVLYRKKS